MGTNVMLDEMVVGEGCRIGKNCHLKYCIMLDNVVIGDNCTLSDCVIDHGCVIGNHCTLSHCVVGQGVTLNDGFTGNSRFIHKCAWCGCLMCSEQPQEDDALSVLWEQDYALGAQGTGYCLPLGVLEEEMGRERDRDGSIDYGWGKSALKGCLG